MSNIIEITNYSAPELDVYARLSEAQLAHIFEPADVIFITESPKVVERALNAGYEPLSLLIEKKHIHGEARDLITRIGDVPIFTAEFDLLTQLTGFQLTRGVLCAMRRRSLPTVAELCKAAKRIAILENVMNPTNVGAIFRSAAALNIDAVLLTPASSDPLYRRASRVSMGTVFQIPWTYLGGKGDAASVWPSAGISLLKELGFKTVAMALCDDSVSIDHPDLLAEDKLAIILGTEGDGLAACTISDCDYTVKIPMAHEVDSLNVAAASAVAFWELGRK